MNITDDKLTTAMNGLRRLARDGGDHSANVVFDEIKALREGFLNVQTIIAGGITSGMIVMPVTDEVKALIEDIFLDKPSCPHCDDPDCHFEDGICSTRLAEDDRLG